MDGENSASWLNSACDLLTRPSPTFCGIAAPAYLVLGVAGIVTGYCVLMALFVDHAISIPVAAVTGAADVAGFVVVGLARARLGRAPHILIEDTLVALAIAAGIAWLLDVRVLLALDCAVVALGVFLMFGRLGCLASGCCHGRPAALGPRYSAGAVDPLIEGVRLFPVQLVEGVWIGFATLLALFHVGEGRALELWLVTYCAGRFALEALRGDLRSSFAGLSSAQWVCVLALVAVNSFELWERDDSVLTVATIASALLVITARVTRRAWYAPPAPFLDARTLPRALSVLADLDARAVREADRRARADLESVAITVERDAADRGALIASYTLAGTDPQHLELLAGLIIQRRSAVQVLRAAPRDDGTFLLLLHDSTPTNADIAGDPRHLLMRAQAWALALPVEQAEAQRRDRTVDYLRPWEGS